MLIDRCVSEILRVGRASKVGHHGHVLLVSLNCSEHVFVRLAFHSFTTKQLFDRVLTHFPHRTRQEASGLSRPVRSANSAPVSFLDFNCCWSHSLKIIFSSYHLLHSVADGSSPPLQAGIPGIERPGLFTAQLCTDAPARQTF
jgi:hypothetical protein